LSAKPFSIAGSSRASYAKGVDLRTRTSLFCGALALAIGLSILLRGRIRRPQLFFAGFAIDMGLWYLAQWLYRWAQLDVWARSTAVLAVLLPQFALHLFEAIMPHPSKRSSLLRTAGLLAVPMFVLAVTPLHERRWARASIFLYVLGLVAAGLGSMAIRASRSGSLATTRRVHFLVLIGALAGVFSLADFLWFVVAPLPPVGAVLSTVFLFVLAQSLNRERLVDLYDLLGHLVVHTALAFCLAGIFYVFVVLFGGFETMYLGAILAAIVILVLFDPLRHKVEGYIHRVLFRERVDLERSIYVARSQLAHVLEVADIASVVLTPLEESRRATGGALYLRDPLSSDFRLAQFFGPPAPPRIEPATARPLIDWLSEQRSLVLEQVGAVAIEQRRRGRVHEAESAERLQSAAEALGPFRTSVMLAIHGEDQGLLGILLLQDDRVGDAFASEEVTLLETLATQIGVVIENSRQFSSKQERDRLAALGQMAAGLAHEIKNPLGAIKGAAQLLNEEHESSPRLDVTSREFVGIILEEVERLDRVVGSVLDYARPSKGNPGLIDVNAVVRRSLQVLSSERNDGINFEVRCAQDLLSVRADSEQLRQVLINLVRNGVQAMNGRGTLRVTTWQRHGWRPGWNAASRSRDWVEIAIQDEGPGIMPQVLENLFVPFFTTKIQGTGLGLAISHRLVEAMGGRILVASQQGQGSTFSVVLPAATEPTVAANAVIPAVQT
jgi:two-component system sensor histidine kinase HydH